MEANFFAAATSTPGASTTTHLDGDARVDALGDESAHVGVSARVPVRSHQRVVLSRVRGGERDGDAVDGGVREGGDDGRRVETVRVDAERDSVSGKVVARFSTTSTS